MNPSLDMNPSNDWVNLLVEQPAGRNRTISVPTLILISCNGVTT